MTTSVAQAEAATLVERKCRHCGATDVGFGCITQIGALDCPRYAPALLTRIAALEAENAALRDTIKVIDDVAMAKIATLSRQVQGMGEALAAVRSQFDISVDGKTAGLAEGGGFWKIIRICDAALSPTLTPANK